jgi:hypothetical protein
MRPADTSSARNERTLDHLAFDMQTARSRQLRALARRVTDALPAEVARAWLREAAQVLR